ncbi:MAG TPA: serine/threonine-protein kinase [Gemmatales bacterium]|nr:serine/threonine-protein kinase [Gemmatales bacterium]
MALPDIPGYEVLDVIGKGGMGQVYRARHLQLQREVAIKVIRPDKVSTDLDAERYKARFRKEATSVAGVNHPNVVQIYEIGEQDGTLFLSMELVEGNSLQKQIDSQGVLSPQAAAEMFVKIAQGVQAVHQQKIIHRDLKPDNILLTKSGEPKITDFGLARPIERDVEETQPGDVVGTPVYMSPEQASLGDEKITPRVDVYGLGATLYCALTGRAPFPRESLKVTLQKVLNEEVVPIRKLRNEVPVDLDTICLMCLNKEPDKRYPSARHFADDLNRFLKNEPIHARPVSRVEKTVKWMRRHPSVYVYLVGMLVILVVLIDAITTSIRSAQLERNVLQEKLKDQYVRLSEQGLSLDAKKLFETMRQQDAHLDNEVKLAHARTLIQLASFAEAESLVDELLKSRLDRQLLAEAQLLKGELNIGKNDEVGEKAIKAALDVGFEKKSDKYYAQALIEPNLIEAKKNLVSALDDNPRHHGALALLALMQVSIGETDEALIRAGQGIVAFQNNLDFVTIKVIAHALRGEQEQVQTTLLEAKKQGYPEYWDTLGSMAKVLYSLHKPISDNSITIADSQKVAMTLLNPSNWSLLAKVYGYSKPDFKRLDLVQVMRFPKCLRNYFNVQSDVIKNIMIDAPFRGINLKTPPDKLKSVQQELEAFPEGMIHMMFAFALQQRAEQYQTQTPNFNRETAQDMFQAAADAFAKAANKSFIFPFLKQLCRDQAISYYTLSGGAGWVNKQRPELLKAALQQLKERWKVNQNIPLDRIEVFVAAATLAKDPFGGVILQQWEKVNPTNIGMLRRRAKYEVAMEMHDKALKTIDQVLKTEPTNEQMKQLREQCRKALEPQPK